MPGSPVRFSSLTFRFILGHSRYCTAAFVPVLPYQATGSICTVQSGNMSVLEFALAADGTLARLALDITAVCNTGVDARVSVRVNSVTAPPF